MRHVRTREPLALLPLVMAVACGGGDEAPGPAGNADPAVADGRATAELDDFGRDPTEAHRIAEGVYHIHGVGNTGFVVTSDGIVAIDAGLPTSADAHLELMRQVDDGPVRAVIATHAHADHSGGTNTFAEDGTEIITHREFPETQRYLTELLPFFMPKNKVFYPDSVVSVPGWAMNMLRRIYPVVEPTILVDDEYAFELGGVRFEVLSTPSAEGADSVSVWLPQQKILFTGDFFGPIFPMVPNLYTIRGEKFRYAIPYIESLDMLIALEPEILVPSHFEPIVGKEQILADMTKTRDAVQYIHDETVAGMNEGKDVYTLMREIRLPAQLDLPESHGRVAWNVRGIWEGYSGWFHFDSTAQLYAVPPSSVHPEIVEMAGGADAVGARARARVDAGEPVEALHLTEMALASDPKSRPALEARLAALELLLERSGGENHSEVFWLRNRIQTTHEQLGS